jgi:flagellin-like hook-associated protein FlgL
MRELAVQSANDTNTASDRSEMQKEIDQLTQEVTRIADTTEFNQKTLLNGGAGIQSTQTASTVAKGITGTSDTKTTGAVVFTGTGVTSLATADEATIALDNASDSVDTGGKITINGDVPGGSLRHIQASWLNDSEVDAIGVIEGVTAIMSNDRYRTDYDEVRMCGWIDAQGNYRISDINPGNARYFYIDLFNDNGIDDTRISISPDENTASANVHNIKNSTRFDLDLSLRKNANPQGLIVWEYLTNINGSQIPQGAYESLANITRY